jgi:hypothetical protein
MASATYPDAIGANNQVMPDNHIVLEPDRSSCVIDRITAVIAFQQCGFA